MNLAADAPRTSACPRADGGVAGVAHHPGVLRRGVPGNDLRHAPPRNPPQRLTALRLAKRWSKVSAVLFAIGAVSGTVLSFEMGLLWPGLMGRFGDVLGLPFAIEGLSFFVGVGPHASSPANNARCRHRKKHHQVAATY
jgi:hypothetical protein